MSDPEPQPTPPPPSPPFQFTLRTLLLLFVVLGSSLAVFGAWGIAVFGLVVGLAIYIRLVRRWIATAYSKGHKVRFQFTLRHLLVATSLLAVALGFGRWIYLAKPWRTPNGMALVAQYESAGGSALLEYRMDKPFKVGLYHRLLRDESQGSLTGVRSETIVIIDSKWDVLRGHFARFRVSSAAAVLVEVDGKTTRVAPWSVADASKTKWDLCEGLQIGDGAGVDLGEIARTKDLEEVIAVYAGTRVP